MTEDFSRAATGYLVWPLALMDIVREAPGASRWERIHARQAAVFGILGTLAYLVLLAVPLLVVIVVPAISSGIVVIVYVLGLIADFIGALFMFGLVLYYSGKASRGELFSIPFVTPICDSLFRLMR